MDLAGGMAESQRFSRHYRNHIHPRKVTMRSISQKHKKTTERDHPLVVDPSCRKMAIEVGGKLRVSNLTESDEYNVRSMTAKPTRGVPKVTVLTLVPDGRVNWRLKPESMAKAPPVSRKGLDDQNHNAQKT